MLKIGKMIRFLLRRQQVNLTFLSGDTIMKVGSSFNLLSTFIVSAMLLTATSGYAEHHGSKKGMNVPKIGSMVVMSGLENPWDMSFTADGSMFYTEKCKGLSVKRHLLEQLTRYTA